VLKLEGSKFEKSVRGTDMSGVLINHVNLIKLSFIYYLTI
jgi:hypothetical protein